MNGFIKHAAIASTAALMMVGSAGLAGAQGYGDVQGDVQMKPQMKPKADQSDFCAVNPDKCAPSRVTEAQSDWKFDPNRHERRRHRDDTFRFKFGLFWYPQPYWQGYGLRVSPRISCGEGRLILRDRGFRRVRPIECQGRTYTYFGRRHGDAFRVLLNARTGRIVDVDAI